MWEFRDKVSGRSKVLIYGRKPFLGWTWLHLRKLCSFWKMLGFNKLTSFLQFFEVSPHYHCSLLYVAHSPAVCSSKSVIFTYLTIPRRCWHSNVALAITCCFPGHDKSDGSANVCLRLDFPALICCGFMLAGGKYHLFNRRTVSKKLV